MQKRTTILFSKCSWSLGTHMYILHYLGGDRAASLNWINVFFRYFLRAMLSIRNIWANICSCLEKHYPGLSKQLWLADNFQGLKWNSFQASSNWPELNLVLLHAKQGMWSIWAIPHLQIIFGVNFFLHTTQLSFKIFVSAFLLKVLSLKYWLLFFSSSNFKQYNNILWRV